MLRSRPTRRRAARTGASTAVAPSVRFFKTTTFEGLIPFLDTGKLGTHETSAFKLNMPVNLASLRNDERFAELFELACKEPDQEKVGDLFEEILCLLESQTKQLDRETSDVNRAPQ